MHFCIYLVCPVLYANQIFLKFQWRRMELWLLYSSNEKLPKWFHLEEPASHDGKPSCWKYVVKLCNVDGRCIDQQGTARFQAFWYAGLWSKSIFLPPEQIYLSPAILHHWESYQLALISSLRASKNLVWSWDGIFDYMGYSVKYGVYSMMCSPSNKIVHFELLQVWCGFDTL